MGSRNAEQVAKKVCEICGFSRATDRCHIYPARIVKTMVYGIGGLVKFKKLGYKGDHIMILCKNCHWLYDHFLLEKEEFDKIKTKVGFGLNECAFFLKAHIQRLYGNS